MPVDDQAVLVEGAGLVGQDDGLAAGRLGGERRGEEAKEEDGSHGGRVGGAAHAAKASLLR